MMFDRSMRHTDTDGRLHVEKTIISIANVCPYYGREISNWEQLGLTADKIYQLYRDPDELKKAAPTYENVPLLEKHIAVSAEEPKKEFWVGTVSDINFEYPNLYGSLAVWDKKGISLIESGEQEQLSAGYYFTAVMTPGVARDGKRYDGRMTELKCNHVALVSEGRVGPDSTIADQSIQPRNSSMTSKYPALAKFLPDGADIVAFDKAMDAEKEKLEEDAAQSAEDAAHDFYGNTAEDWNTKTADEKQAARDEFEKEKSAKDGEVDHRKDFDGGKDSRPTGITQDQMDAAIKTASDATAKRINDLHAAREAVRPIVGVVTMDSADEVYAFALKHSGVKLDGVHPSAYPALLDLVKSRKPSKPAQPAFDASAHNVSSIWKKQA